MTCPSCGLENTGRTLCSGCGASLEGHALLTRADQPEAPTSDSTPAKAGTVGLVCPGCSEKLNWGDSNCAACKKAICRGLPVWLDNLIMLILQLIAGIILYIVITRFWQFSRPLRILIAGVIANRVFSGWSLAPAGAYVCLRLPRFFGMNMDGVKDVDWDVNRMAVWINKSDAMEKTVGRVSLDDWSRRADRTLHDVMACLLPQREASALSAQVTPSKALVTTK